MSLLFFISKLISLFCLINFLINQLFLNSIKINMQLIELLDFNMTGIKLSSFLYSNCCYGHFLKSFHLFFSIFWIINYSNFQLTHLYNFLDFLSSKDLVTKLYLHIKVYLRFRLINQSLLDSFDRYLELVAWGLIVMWICSLFIGLFYTF